MKIRSKELPPIGTNAYLLSDNGHALLIDAPEQAWNWVQSIIKEEQLVLDAVLLTHAHFDHVLGVARFNQADIPVYLHEEEQVMVEKLPQQMQMFGFPTKKQVVTVDHWVKDGDSLNFLGQNIKMLRVAGHSPGNIVYYFADYNCAFVGDAIFAGSVGRTDLPGGNFKQLEQGIRQQIYSLPQDTVLYPGHGPETTVGHECKTNPYVQAK